MRAALQNKFYREIGKMSFHSIHTKVFLFLPLFLTALFLCTLNAEAASVYYVRAGATGGNSGSDWTNAFTALPSTLVRGATYYVAGGSYGSHAFNDPLSGTTYIYIEKATSANHGPSTDWQDSFGAGQATFTDWTFNTGYYDIDGQVGGGPGTSVSQWPGSWTAGLGFGVIKASDGNKRILFNAGANNIAIRHTEITNTDTNNYADLIYAYGNVTYITFSYCYIHHAYGCMLQTAYAGTNNWTIEYSMIGDNTGTSANHSEIWSRTGSDNFTWRYNYIYQWRSTGAMYATGPGTGLNGTGDLNVSQNIYIYGNVFNQQGTTTNWFIAAYNDGSYDYQYASGWLIANNTFLNLAVTGDTWIYAIFLMTNGSYNPNIVKNNIWYGNSAGMEIHVTTEDYNSYQGSGQYFTAANDSALASSPFVNFSSGDYHLAAPLLADTSIGAQYLTDMFGNVGNYRGALQPSTGGSTGSKPSPPQNLGVQ